MVAKDEVLARTPQRRLGLGAMRECVAHLVWREHTRPTGRGRLPAAPTPSLASSFRNTSENEELRVAIASANGQSSQPVGTRITSRYQQDGHALPS